MKRLEKKYAQLVADGFETVTVAEVLKDLRNARPIRPREERLVKLLASNRKIMEGLCAGCPCYPPLGKTCRTGMAGYGCVVRNHLLSIDAELGET